MLDALSLPIRATRTRLPDSPERLKVYFINANTCLVIVDSRWEGVVTLMDCASLARATRVAGKASKVVFGQFRQNNLRFLDFLVISQERDKDRAASSRKPKHKLMRVVERKLIDLRLWAGAGSRFGPQPHP
jgi:hypothetical protein